MDNKAIGLLAIGALALLASGAALAATNQSGDSESLDVPDPFTPNEGLDMAAWKINEYPKYATAIAEAERRWSIPTDLYARQLFQESRYRADVISGAKRSPVGAVGIAEFMPDTAKQYGLIKPDGTDLRTDPYASIEAGAHYMHDLYMMFHDWRNALMAYNWGPGNVQHMLRGDTHPKTGRPYTPPGETATYVAQITSDVAVA